MGAKYWYYHDWDNDIRWYTEAYLMSASDFASQVSDEIGKYITASDISCANSDKELDRFSNLKHI